MLVDPHGQCGLAILSPAINDDRGEDLALTAM
jgi:hypothetical protein